MASLELSLLSKELLQYGLFNVPKNIISILRLDPVAYKEKVQALAAKSVYDRTPAIPSPGVTMSSLLNTWTLLSVGSDMNGFPFRVLDQSKK